MPVDWLLFDEIHAQDFVDLSSAGRESTKKAFAQSIRELIIAFPDLSTKIENLVIDEESQQVAIRWSSIGTNKVKFLDIGPTDRLTLITGIEIIHVSGGLITKRWGEWDISNHQKNFPGP